MLFDTTLQEVKPHLYRCGSVWCCRIRYDGHDVFGWSVTKIGAFMDAQMWCEAMSA